MPKEDYLSKQISQLGFFLKKALEKLTKMKSESDSLVSVSEINQKMQEELGFDLNTIENLSEAEIIAFLERQPLLNSENLEILADILLAVNKQDLSKKALLLYHHINIKTATFSFERNSKIERLKQKLG